MYDVFLENNLGMIIIINNIWTVKLKTAVLKPYYKKLYKYIWWLPGDFFTPFTKKKYLIIFLLHAMPSTANPHLTTTDTLLHGQDLKSNQKRITGNNF